MLHSTALSPWITLLVLFLIIEYPTLTAGQANRTLDDFSPQITYTPASAVTHLDTTGFDPTKLYNGTIGVMNGSSSTEGVNMTMHFTGTAVWLFLAQPSTTDGFGTAFTVFLDGAQVDDVGEGSVPGDAAYADLGYSNTKLPPGPHSIVMASDPGLPLYFDYGVFTSNNPDPETSIPPVLPLPSSSAASSAASKTTGTPASASQSGVVPKKTGTSHVAAIAGATAGATVLIGAVVVLFLLCRRRRRQRPSNSSYHGGEPQMPWRGPAFPSEYAYAARSPAPVMVDSVPHTAPSPSPSRFEHQPQYPAPQPPQRQAVEYGYPPQQQQPSPVLYTPTEDTDTDVRRMLAEQRAIEAEYARPTAWTVDEKVPAGARTPNGDARTDVENIAAEMAALRAQVARLEGTRGVGAGAGGEQVELPPPAYD
ncbi:hypothetical protein C8R46DRAFT_1327015 [Mycena filopes]|nr:hypothetical protein C8R46DRAFT_1327015 [Mycena filopes]